MSQVAEHLYTEEEYLRLEDERVDDSKRYEFIDGALRLLTGTTKNHNTLVQNFVLKCVPLSREKNYQLAVQNVRVKLLFGVKNRYYYPDVVLTCYSDSGDERTIENPCMVVEIVSKSTSRIDKGEKLDTYQRIPSIKQYAIVDQARRKIEVYTRQDDKWIYQTLESGQFEIPCLETTMTLDEVYAGLTF
jgi:Uma2 family endonuclease